VTDRFDVVVVGGGIVGLAAAHRILEARPDLSLAVLEREATVGEHQSSRNSGVLHAGLYYRPGSAKARWCTAGKREMERFCAEHGVPVIRNGTVVVAVDRSELPGLRLLTERAHANGVDVELLDGDGVREHEPHVSAVAGLRSPGTAVTDFGQVCRALERVVTEAGGEVRTGVEVTGLADRPAAAWLTTTTGELEARAVVTAAGLQADRMATLSGSDVPERIVPFRGAWLVLRQELTSLVRGSIYPVPQPGGLPFLGVHLTRRLDGSVWIGPNAVLAGARHGRTPWAVDRRDLRDSLLFPGLWHLARHHLRTGVTELWRDRILPATIREVQRYVPAITADDVARGPWGVRAQLLGPDGVLIDDFTLRSSGRILHVLNAPSPAATASLAIGAEIRDRVLARL
jgi:(S)-2-hydroxyglutarate dehydrogenase